MTRSNRLANRILLVIVGLIALALGAVLAAPRLLPLLGLPSFDVPAPSDIVLAIVVAASAIVIVFALIWTFSRGRGRTREAVVDGAISVDASVAEALLRQSLDSEPDILGVHVTAYRRRTRVLLVRVTTRRSPDLERVRASLSAAIASLDDRLGAEVPIAVQLSSGARTTFAPARIAH